MFQIEIINRYTSTTETNMLLTLALKHMLVCKHVDIC